MFTWICPQCGNEVPPSYADCPNCKPAAAEPPRPPAPAPVATPPRATARPTPTSPPPTPAAPAHAPQPLPQYAYAPPPQRPGIPPWLATIGVFAVLCGVGYAYYTLVLAKHGAAASASTASVEPAPAEASKEGGGEGGRGSRDMSRHLEATAIRIVEERRQPTIRLMVVNHSNVDMAGLSGTISLTAGPNAELAAIPFSIASLGAYEAKDISAPLKTKLRAYELPDWQFIKAQVKLNP